MKDFKEIIAEQIAKATNIEKDKIITNIEVFLTSTKSINKYSLAITLFE